MLPLAADLSTPSQPSNSFEAMIVDGVDDCEVCVVVEVAECPSRKDVGTGLLYLPESGSVAHASCYVSVASV